MIQATDYVCPGYPPQGFGELPRTQSKSVEHLLIELNKLLDSGAHIQGRPAFESYMRHKGPELAYLFWEIYEQVCNSEGNPVPSDRNEMRYDERLEADLRNVGVSEEDAAYAAHGVRTADHAAAGANLAAERGFAPRDDDEIFLREQAVQDWLMHRFCTMILHRIAIGALPPDVSGFSAVLEYAVASARDAAARVDLFLDRHAGSAA